MDEEILEILGVADVVGQAEKAGHVERTETGAVRLTEEGKRIARELLVSLSVRQTQLN
jgi:Mn-dependent DtxR family transcriptional regulator